MQITHVIGPCDHRFWRNRIDHSRRVKLGGRIKYFKRLRKFGIYCENLMLLTGVDLFLVLIKQDLQEQCELVNQFTHRVRILVCVVQKLTEQENFEMQIVANQFKSWVGINKVAPESTGTPFEGYQVVLAALLQLE